VKRAIPEPAPNAAGWKGAHHPRKDLSACNEALASRCGLAIITANFGDIHLVALKVALNLRVALHAFSRYRH
jgi:hypothetical protein